ncbi:MAG: hypothetical protein AB7Q81_00560 [Gammaproteobacteria bacterium]
MPDIDSQVLGCMRDGGEAVAQTGRSGMSDDTRSVRANSYAVPTVSDTDSQVPDFMHADTGRRADRTIRHE